MYTGLDDIVARFFPEAYTEVEFVNRTYGALKGHGFRDENTIASVCVCRDEISQSMRSIVKHIWGEAFNLSSLAGMFFAGKTGLKAALHHSPIDGGQERYVFYAMPHIAIDEKGNMGRCRRDGREDASTACGALAAFQKEMEGGRLEIGMDYEDVEQSLIRMRLIRKIPYGHVPDLLELTKIALSAIQEDLESTLGAVVEAGRNDYAVMTGIQVHGPRGNYVWPTTSYAVVEGVRKDIKLQMEGK